MKLLEVIKERLPLIIELDKDFILEFTWENNRYQSRCGFMPIEVVVDIATGKNKEYKIVERIIKQI